MQAHFVRDSVVHFDFALLECFSRLLSSFPCIREAGVAGQQATQSAPPEEPTGAPGTQVCHPVAVLLHDAQAN